MAAPRGQSNGSSVQGRPIEVWASSSPLRACKLGYAGARQFPVHRESPTAIVSVCVPRDGPTHRTGWLQNERNPSYTLPPTAKAYTPLLIMVVATPALSLNGYAPPTNECGSQRQGPREEGMGLEYTVRPLRGLRRSCCVSIPFNYSPRTHHTRTTKFTVALRKERYLRGL